ncbi:MAG: hypothetical protein QXJ14_03485 [Candidatus Aenigmatarchaeota archaeon]
MKSKEASLKKQILDFLRLNKIFAWNNRNVGVYNPKTGHYIPSQIKGVSDIIGILPDGRFLAIEVKVNNNKPTIYQLAFLEEVLRNNGIAILAYSLDDVIDNLKDYLGENYVYNTTKS